MTGVSRRGETSVPGTAADLLASVRPDQWTKNVIVFAGLVFGGQLLDPAAVARALAAFLVFCVLSGAMYLLNDIGDRERDRLHPLKATRPIAAGRVTPAAAGALAAVLLAAGVLGAFLVGTRLGWLALLFIGLLTLYSRTLKRLVVLDVLTIAVGFVLRAIGGAVAVGVPFSQWLLVCTFLGALFLGLTKRRQEVRALGDDAARHRPALDRYTPAALDQMVTIVAGATLLSYAVYTTDPDTVQRFGTDLLTLTIPFPIYGVFRYLLLMRDDALAGPSDILLRDRPLAACVAGWTVAVALIIYLP